MHQIWDNQEWFDRWRNIDESMKRRQSILIGVNGHGNKKDTNSYRGGYESTRQSALKQMIRLLNDPLIVKRRYRSWISIANLPTYFSLEMGNLAGCLRASKRCYFQMTRTRSPTMKV